MDAIIITLFVTVPIIAVGVLIWQWSHRNEAVSARLASILRFAVGAWILLVWLGVPIKHSQLLRSIVGISMVSFTNESGTDLSEVEVGLRGSDGSRFTHRFGTFAAGRCKTFGFWRSEVILERIACLRGSERFSTTNSGTATPGKILAVRLDSASRFAVSRE